MDTDCAPLPATSSFTSPFCSSGWGFVHVPTRDELLPRSGTGGTGLGRKITKATTPRAITAAATMPRTSAILDGRPERDFSAVAVGGGNCTATVACTGAVSVAAV